MYTVKTTTDNTSSEKDKEFWEKVNDIEGLSVQIGLERVSGQADIYEDALKLLVKEIEKCIGNLKEFLAADDMHNFTIVAHSIKSSLANIGALELSSRAYELEISSGRKDNDFCASALQAFLDSLDSLRNKLKEAFPQSPQVRGTIVIPPELTLILTRMRDAFIKMEFVEINNEIKNLETFTRSNDHSNGELKNEIDEIMDAVMVMDYDNATEVIEKLLQGV
jgi:HPt (histidine-containing phosphotransfer) domain-containing protein